MLAPADYQRLTAELKGFVPRSPRPSRDSNAGHQLSPARHAARGEPVQNVFYKRRQPESAAELRKAVEALEGVDVSSPTVVRDLLLTMGGARLMVHRLAAGEHVRPQ
jgi:hypothetical protein